MKIEKYLNLTGSTICPVEEGESDSNAVKLQLYGKWYYTYPKYVSLAENIAEEVFSRIGSVALSENVEKYITQFEENESLSLGFDFKLAAEQKEGVLTLLSEKMAILTGGPGTGKTSVLKCVAKVLEQLHPGCTIAFMAPTGKAARRVTESSGYPAVTIQSKIGDTGDENQCLNLITDDYAIVDEVSMADEETFYNLLRCLSRKTCLYLVGDENQLPSVGKGAVLRDLIDSRIVPVCQLEKIFRQKDGSTLAENIEIVKKGGYISFIEGNDFKKQNLDTLLSDYMEEVEKRGIENVVILTPTRKAGEYCSEKLNNIIQQAVNPNGRELKTEVKRDGRQLPISFREGDPVMQLKNREVANGDVGKVVSVTASAVTVQYYDCQITYTLEELWQLDLAYAISIHKSQGSEYHTALLLLNNGKLDRNMIYTALTRAKKQALIYGDEDSILSACKIQSTWQRNTLLCFSLETVALTDAIITQTLKEE